MGIEKSRRYLLSALSLSVEVVAANGPHLRSLDGHARSWMAWALKPVSGLVHRREYANPSPAAGEGRLSARAVPGAAFCVRGVSQRKQAWLVTRQHKGCK
jgi:hypothetical protein